MAKAGAGAEQSIIIIKKKKAGGHAAHGGAWKVAYAVDLHPSLTTMKCTATKNFTGLEPRYPYTVRS